MIQKLYGGRVIPVGERLRRFREARGLSQAELGELLSVRGPTISRYETENSQLRAIDLPRIADALGVHPCDFFEEPERGGGAAVAAAERSEWADWVRQQFAAAPVGELRGPTQHLVIRDLMQHGYGLAAEEAEELARLADLFRRRRQRDTEPGDENPDV